MPELPEVETVKAALDTAVGKVITSIKTSVKPCTGLFHLIWVR